ncbi:hypothetical protein [Noviherbaspirillum massiliense]|uniref:hypothetical protein n=1 Tax=Noviherbaspirillum massiliense TaxID=1465823 RepID=UPI0002F5C231|nr:hypothetical protein [Noviherbaspirillum massiliense]
MEPDYATLTHKELGRALASRLADSVNPGATELQEAQNASVNSHLYFSELYFLCGFAVFHAVAAALGDSAASQEVRDGYLEAFKSQASENATTAALFRVFCSRLEAYQEVARDMAPADLTPLASRFGSFLSPSAEGKARLLAQKYGPVYFSTHIENTLNILRSAGLLT